MFVIKKSPKGLSSFVLGSWLYLLLYTFVHASVNSRARIQGYAIKTQMLKNSWLFLKYELL